MRAAIVALLLAGCYSPSPPGGSYLCGEGDACPSNLHCKCNQCVADDAQAACSFRLSVPSSPLNVREHAPFAVTVQALDEGGAPATGFVGEVSISASWGDACVGGHDCLKASRTVHVEHGTGTAMVSLNRETIPPQTAVLFAEFAGRRGSSESARINVGATPFKRDLGAVVPRVNETSKFGPLDVFAAVPTVEYASGQFRMYLSALSTSFSSGSAIALATSGDGLHFDATSVKEVFHQPLPGTMNAIGNPSLFTMPGGERRLLYTMGETTGTKGNGAAQIGLATSPDGLTPFTDLGIVLRSSDCAFCAAGFQPGGVIADPFPQLSGNGSAGGWIAFFTGVGPLDTDMIPSISIGRAISSDGQSFTIDSDALLTNATQLGKGELLLLSPRVLLDGSVLKMWYSYAIIPPITMSTLDLCAGPLAQLGRIEIGYATSQDGYFWTRSPFRKAGAGADAPGNPVLATTLDPMAYDGGAVSLLVSAAVPTDGLDPSNGIAIYYSAFFQETFTLAQRGKLAQQGFAIGDSACIANGAGRASRP